MEQDSSCQKSGGVPLDGSCIKCHSEERSDAEFILSEVNVLRATWVNSLFIQSHLDGEEQSLPST